MGSMQSLNDEERREVLGEVLMDELNAIHEYVKEIPGIKNRLDTLEEKMDKMGGRLNLDETILKAHEIDIRTINRHLSLA
jgi:hypothetical protein